MAMSTKSLEGQPHSSRLLLAAGAVGPLLFILAFLVIGATRPAYSAWHMAVSSLSDGPLGWTQTTNFVVCGALLMCFAFGLKRALRAGKGATWGPILLGTFGLCMIGAGFFTTDPGLGYPPGAATPATPSVHGALHGLFSLVGFASLIAACFVLARRFTLDPAWHGWSLYSILTGSGFLVFLVLTSFAAASGDPTSPAGLLQRIMIVVGWVWLALFAIQLLRKGPPVSR
jgi:Protein of unknown function (DUF998)